MAISGNTVIVGAIGDTTSGSAYLFDSSGTELFKLIPSDAQFQQNFGISVGISDSTAIVGAHKTGNGVGSAYLFDTATGTELFKLTASDAAAFDGFCRKQKKDRNGGTEKVSELLCRKAPN